MIWTGFFLVMIIVIFFYIFNLFFRIYRIKFIKILIHNNPGEIYFTKGDAANAVVYFNKAIAIKPDWPPAYRQRGYALLNLADYKGALESFQKFLELAPDDPRAAVIRSLIPELEKMIKK